MSTSFQPHVLTAITLAALATASCGAAGESDGPPGSSASTPKRTAPAEPAAQKTSDAEAQRLVLRLHTTRDAASENMESHRILAPQGWTVEGGAWWAPPQFFSILPSQDIRVTGPDGHRVHIGPSIAAADSIPSPMAVQQLGARRAAEGTAENGFPVMHMPSNIDEWSRWIREKGFAQSRPEASDLTVEEVVIVPELTELLQRQLAPQRRQAEQQNQHAAAMGVFQQNFVGGAIFAATVTYREADRQWEEVFLFGASYSGFDMEVGRQLNWALEPNISFRAPAGELEESLPLLMTIASSLAPTSQWRTMAAQHAQRMNEIAAQGAADRSRIMAESHREVSRIINEGWESRQASMERTHRRVSETIRGVARYSVPGSNEVVQLPFDYNHIYADGQGSYILTNDPLYDPNRDPALNRASWESMKQVKD